MKISVSKDTARPALTQMLKDVRSRGFYAKLALRLVVTLQSHFAEKETRPNKQGWPKSHFWSQIRSSTLTREVTDSGATVGIADGRFNTHYYGATISPTKKQYLTIPLKPEAKGIYPGSGEIPGLFVLRAKSGALLLAKKEDGHLGFFYLLKKHVVIPVDPTALPPDAKIETALVTEAGKWLPKP